MLTFTTIISGAGEVGGVFPDDLAEVTPGFEIRWVGFTVASIVGAYFAVVEHAGNDFRDVVGSHTSGNVLTVATAIHLAVTCKCA